MQPPGQPTLAVQELSSAEQEHESKGVAVKAGGVMRLRQMRLRQMRVLAANSFIDYLSSVGLDK